MSLKEKYQAVVDFIGEHAEPERIWQEDGKLKISAIVDTTQEREIIEQEIEAMGTDTPADLSLYLRVRETEGDRVHLMQHGRPPVATT